MMGTVKWFNDAKGFGFITPEKGGKDVFVHHTAIQAEGFRTLSEGDEVEFEVVTGKGGKKQADKVKLVKKATHAEVFGQPKGRKAQAAAR